MKDSVKKHFQKHDPILYQVALRVGPMEDVAFRSGREYFRSLCREIIAQQLAGGAARAILGRFSKLFPRGIPTAKALAGLPDQSLRDTGMSWAKVRYLKDLAQKMNTREISLSHLSRCSDEEAIRELMQMKGIGQWTAEMFLMFSLGREDVFSYGDRGLQKAMEKLYGMNGFSFDQAQPIVETWKPYRTWASRLLWKSLEI